MSIYYKRGGRFSSPTLSISLGLICHFAQFIQLYKTQWQRRNENLNERTSVRVHTDTFRLWGMMSVAWISSNFEENRNETPERLTAWIDCNDLFVWQSGHRQIGEPVILIASNSFSGRLLTSKLEHVSTHLFFDLVIIKLLLLLYYVSDCRSAQSTIFWNN